MFYLSDKLLRVFFVFVVFTGSFLLFSIQPLLGKFLLPFFGGSALVFSSAIFFFITVLFFGYLYSYFILRFSFYFHSALHIGLLLLTLIIFYFINTSWQTLILEGPFLEAKEGIFPLFRILIFLIIVIGLPYFLLSSTVILSQSWFERALKNSPYSLYAVSNAGGFFAIGLYPFFIEPMFTLTFQRKAWLFLFFLYVVVFVMIIFALRKRLKEREFSYFEISKTVEGEEREIKEIKDNKKQKERNSLLSILTLKWLSFSLIPVLALLTLTNHMSQKITPVPFLWLLPLGIYLVSFIIVFSRWHNFYRRNIFSVLLIFGATLSLFFKNPLPLGMGIIMATLAYCLMLFSLFIICHGELYKLRPKKISILPFFYLVISFGGVIGAVLINIIAPLVFNDFLEFFIVIWISIMISFFLLLRNNIQNIKNFRFVFGFFSILFLYLIGIFIIKIENQTEISVRNFYGSFLIKTVDKENLEYPVRVIIHNGVVHGAQFISDNKEIRNEPLTYYTRSSGVGIAIENHKKRENKEEMRIGLVGLGAGVLAAYKEENDYCRFYEINPGVKEVAEKYFTFLGDKNCDVVINDARIALQEEKEKEFYGDFDILAVDAFNGGTIPLHLITKEAIELYFDHLREGGILAIHISNVFLDLGPVLATISKELEIDYIRVKEDKKNSEDYHFSSDWVLLSKGDELKKEVFSFFRDENPKTLKRLWTDDFSNVFEIIRWR